MSNRLDGLWPEEDANEYVDSKDAEIARLTAELEALSIRLATPVAQLRDVAEVEVENQRLTARLAEVELCVCPAGKEE